MTLEELGEYAGYRQRGGFDGGKELVVTNVLAELIAVARAAEILTISDSLGRGPKSMRRLIENLRQSNYALDAALEGGVS